MKIVDFSSLPSFLFLDIFKVGVRANCKEIQEEGEPTFTLVVASIWFVPIWEYSYVLVGVLGLIAWFGITWERRVHILLGNV